jgi:hypothetical protein
MSSDIFKKRLGTATNLANGGTYDMLLITFPDSFPEGKIEFDIGDTPRKITGVQKVAQTFMKMLFTTVGSNVLYPDQGTGFSLLTVNANVTQNDTLFAAELANEIRSAESQTKYILNSVNSDPASQLQEVSIIGIDTSSESVVVYLKMITKAGALAQVAVPFPQLDMILSEDN